MTSISRSVIKNFCIYSAGTIALKLITAGTTFLVIRLLTPQQYGLLALLNTLVAVIPILLSLGLRQAFGVEYVHLTSAQRKQMVNDLCILYLTISTPLLLVLLANTRLLNSMLFTNNAPPGALTITLLTCFISFFAELFLQALRYQCRARTLTFVQLGAALATMCCTLLCIYILRLHILGVILGQLVGQLAIALYGWRLYHQRVGVYAHDILRAPGRTRYYFKLGLPFIPSIIFSWIITAGDRWVLANLGTLHDVGIYALADTFGQLFNAIVLQALIASYIPSMLRRFAQNPDDILVTDAYNHRLMWLCMIVTSVIITAGYLVARPMLGWALPPKYHPALGYIWAILMSAIPLMGSYFATCYLQFFKKTYLLVALTTGASLVNIALDALLIPYLHITGAIAATGIAYSLYLCAILMITSHYKRRHADALAHLQHAQWHY